MKNDIQPPPSGLNVAVSGDAAFVIEHVFAAPLALVWQVYTEPQHLSQWMRPAGLTDAGCTVDLRPGGVFHYGMGTPDGQVMWGKWTYLNVAPPSAGLARMQVIVSFSDAQQGVTRHPMSATWPLQTLSDMTLSAEGDSTRLRLEWRACNATELEQTTFNSSHAGMTQGWSGTLKGLEAYLAGLQARMLEVTRTVPFAPATVFAAFTTAEALAQWWGPNGFSISTQRFDFRVGGVWQFMMHGPDGKDYPNKVVFRAIEPPVRMAHWHGDFSMADDGQGAFFEADILLEPVGTGTRVHNRLCFATPEMRQAVERDHQAREGGEQTLARLDAYLQGRPTRQAVV